MQEGLVGARPEGFGRIEPVEHGPERRDGRFGNEDAGIQTMKIGKVFIDIGGRGELRIAKQPVDVPENDRVRIDEHAAGIIRQLPEAQLAEIVERRMEGRLAALGEGRLVVDAAAGVALVEGIRERQQFCFDEAAAEGGKWRKRVGRNAAGVKNDDVGRCLRQTDRAEECAGAERIIVVGDERHECMVRGCRGEGAKPLLLIVDRCHETDFSRLPSGSWSMRAAISLVQAETAGTRARSTR
ncbi:hypothetical protein D3C87_1451150 [compost metagenome]